MKDAHWFTNRGETKNMNKHTPGPWKLIDKRQDPRTDGIAINAENSFQVYDNDLNQIAKINPEFEANARLIAAAPELLEALKLLLSDNRLMNAMSKGQAKAVMYSVAKAEGEE